MTNTETLAKLTKSRREVEEYISQYNKALRAGDFKQMTAVETLLKAAEKTYNGLSMNNFFEQVSDPDDVNLTMKRAISELTYQVIGHATVKEDDVVIGIKVVEKSKMVDLEKLCTYNSFDKSWVYMLEKFNLLLTCRAATELLKNEKDKNAKLKAVLKTINDSYAMRRLSQDIELGGTPTSNTQICKQLQKLVDSILFVEGETNSGVNSIRVNNRDVAYLLMCYTKHGRSALKVLCANHGIVKGVVTEIIHRIIEDKVYDVDYRMKKSK